MRKLAEEVVQMSYTDFVEWQLVILVHCKELLTDIFSRFTDFFIFPHK